METKQHIINLTGMVVVAFFIAIIQNGGFFESFKLGIVFLIGTMLVPLVPALVILIIGFIIRAFRKSNWEKIYTVAWAFFIIINAISIIGNLI